MHSDAVLFFKCLSDSVERLLHFARGVEHHLRPMLHRRLKVVDRRGKVHRVAVDVGRKTGVLLLAEVLAGLLVGEREPAGRGDVGRLVNGVNLVLRGKALGHDFKLKLTDGTQKDVAELAGEDLNGAFFAEILQALLKLLGLERVFASGGAEEFRRKARDAREAELLAFGKCIADVERPEQTRKNAMRSR